MLLPQFEVSCFFSVNSPHYDAIECLCIEILNKHSKRLTLNLSYRPVQGDTALFEKRFQVLLLRHDLCKKEVLITRDFKINLLDFENNKQFKAL